jgi:hypothetical protein
LGVNTIDFVNPVATGNFADFGDLVNAGQTTNVSHCNNVKTISADGSGDDDGLVITHMASQGNSSSFKTEHLLILNGLQEQVIIQDF